jgi:hypothetical protein
MRILMVLVLGSVSLAAAPKPEVPKHKAPVHQGAAVAHARSRAKAAKGNKPALAGRAAKNPPKRPKVYHK